MLQKILVPLDGSELAEKALPYARALTQKFEAELILVMILEPFSYAAIGEYGGMVVTDHHTMVERRGEAEAYLGKLQEKLSQQNISTRIEILENAVVADGIVEIASQEGVDVIVKTTHGRSGLSRWVFGSVATKVLQEAPCPVFLVRVSGN